MNSQYKKLYVLLSIFIVVILAACGGDDGDNNGSEGDTDTPTIAPTEPETTMDTPEDDSESASMGDAEQGQQVFADLSCANCHAVDSAEVVVGPSLMNIANVAGTRVEGISAEDYLRQSVVAPDEHIVEGFEAGSMPGFEDQLDEQQLNDLVGYLMTLGG